MLALSREVFSISLGAREAFVPRGRRHSFFSLERSPAPFDTAPAHPPSRSYNFKNANFLYAPSLSRWLVRCMLMHDVVYASSFSVRSSLLPLPYRVSRFTSAKQARLISAKQEDERCLRCAQKGEYPRSSHTGLITTRSWRLISRDPFGG